MRNEPESEPVVKLPRGRGLRLSGPELFRIAFTLAMLIAVAVLTKPCSTAVSTFVMGMDGSGQGAAVRKPGAIDSPSHAPTRSPAPPRGAEGMLPNERAGHPENDVRAPGHTDRFEHLRPGMTEDEVKSAIERAKAKAAPTPTRPETVE